MIIMNIVAYLAIIISNALVYVHYNRELLAFETNVICNLAIYSVCNVIFGLIVN
jgi:hypothetical protein